MKEELPSTKPMKEQRKKKGQVPKSSKDNDILSGEPFSKLKVF